VSDEDTDRRCDICDKRTGAIHLQWLELCEGCQNRAALAPADARERVAKVLWSKAATIVDQMDEARRVADEILAALAGGA
jgi:hypothetical protein